MQIFTQRIKWFFALALIFSSGVTNLQAQKITRVKGLIIDKNTKETLPFVNVGFVGTTVGTTTDFDGYFEIESQWVSEQIFASYVGYQSDTFDIVVGKRQTINFELESSSQNLSEIVITAKKKRYKRRGNPAVSFVKKAIANKDKNRLESQQFYQLNKYEKIQLDLNNITDKFREKRIFKKFQFIFDNVDTSAINGKPYLPIYLQEENSRVYYRDNPKDKKTYRDAAKITSFSETMDDETVTQLMTMLYQDYNIYDDNIEVLGLPFVSPLSIAAPFFYHFYINDSTEVNGIKAIDLAFQPANKQNFGFKGNIYISLDSAYTVLKVDMGITDQINLNWVSDMRINQEFEKFEDLWIVSKDKLLIDFQLTKKGMGFFGRKSTVLSDIVFNKPPDDPTVFDAATNKIDVGDVFEVKEEYWTENRPVELSEKEVEIYQMVDTLREIPAFKTGINIINTIATGYLRLGKIDIGPINGFYSFNNVEGTRLRFGGETNRNWSSKVRLHGQILYALGDKKWKYSTQALFSFNKDFTDNPRHHIIVRQQHDTNFPGQILEFINEDNFLLSFKRGNTDKMILFTSSKIDYLKEYRSGFSYQLGFERRRERPIGDLKFVHKVNEVVTNEPHIDVTEAKIKLRWAPNEQFLQGRVYRTNIFNKYPIFTFDYNAGLPDVLSSDYDYHRLKLNIFKRFQFSFLGIAHVYLEGGKIFGEVPFNLMFLPRANQTYAFQEFSYNQMNFLEFVSDQYVSLSTQYFMNGYLLNKIPLIKRLKLREVFTFKMLYGNVTDANNPNLNPELIQFPTDEFGTASTYTLEDKPYIEGSIGLSNVFKVLTLDLVKRFNYLDNPGVPKMFGVRGLGLRFRVGMEF